MVKGNPCRSMAAPALHEKIFLCVGFIHKQVSCHGGARRQLTTGGSIVGGCSWPVVSVADAPAGDEVPPGSPHVETIPTPVLQQHEGRRTSQPKMLENLHQQARKKSVKLPDNKEGDVTDQQSAPDWTKEGEIKSTDRKRGRTSCGGKREE